jgi:diketogulonate reductase-like aldo/keto reductase
LRPSRPVIARSTPLPVYHNQEAVGHSIKKSGLSRQELFITTKLWLLEAGYENTKKAFQKSLDNLGLDYLDLISSISPLTRYTAPGEPWSNCRLKGKSGL